MIDLISRSDVVQILKECNLDETLFEKDVFDKINNLPMAYSVDGVVEELEETMQDLSVIEVFSHIDFDSTIQSGLDNFLKSYNSELLRIVKQGGVSDVADDVCVWKQTSTARYKTSCGYKLEEYFDTNACYCKQCGKKIKILGDGIDEI